MHCQKDGNTNGKFRMLGFVAEQVHTYKDSKASAQGGNSKYSCLRYTPPIFYGLHLVHQHNQKSGGIHCNQIDKKRHIKNPFWRLFYEKVTTDPFDVFFTGRL